MCSSVTFTPQISGAILAPFLFLNKLKNNYISILKRCVWCQKDTKKYSTDYLDTSFR